MIKLGLFGDSAIQHYSVAERLWELISVVIDKKLRFSVVPLASPTDALAAFEAFKSDSSFIGINIAPVTWDSLLVDHVDTLEDPSNALGINTIYKKSDGSVSAANTYPLVAQRAIEVLYNLYKCRSVLIIGAHGTGLPIARHFADVLDKDTYLYDAFYEDAPTEESIHYLSSLHDVSERTYDLIINATPLGRYYFDRRVEAFTSPLDLETLSEITHADTIIQETNYLPENTLLLQMAKYLKLRVCTGSHMLVFEAVESLRRYFDITLSESTVLMLVDEISAYIADREASILEQT